MSSEKCRNILHLSRSLAFYITGQDGLFCLQTRSIVNFNFLIARERWWQYIIYKELWWNLNMTSPLKMQCKRTVVYQHTRHEITVYFVACKPLGPVYEWPSYDLLCMDTMQYMMTSSNGSIFRVTAFFCGEFTSHRRIPRTKGSDAELWCFLWFAPE